MTWHVEAATWRAYRAGELGVMAEAAMEAHVTACPRCQLAARAAHPDAGRVWQSVHGTISHPRPPAPARWLRHLGVADEDVVVLTASDAFRLPWALAVGGALVSMIATAGLGRLQDVGFLLLAPLVPVVAVLAAFDAADPLRELTAATPFSKIRLGLARTLATLMVALPTLAVVAALVPVLHPLLWVWLLPSLGLTGAALALLRWLAPWHAAAGTAVLWGAAVTAAGSAGHLDRLGNPLVQAVFAALAAVSIAVYLTSTRAGHPRMPR